MKSITSALSLGKFNGTPSPILHFPHDALFPDRALKGLLAPAFPAVHRTPMFLSRTYSMKAGAAKAQKFAREHPGWTAAAGVALLGTGACLVAPQAALGALGWQAAGPVAGAPAAWIQSAVYGAHTTGAFSAIQSFTMTGAAAAVGMVAAGCVNLAAGAGLIGVAAKEKVMKRRRA